MQYTTIHLSAGYMIEEKCHVRPFRPTIARAAKAGSAFRHVLVNVCLDFQVSACSHRFISRVFIFDYAQPARFRHPTAMSNSPRRKRAPVYFLSIGGPSSIEDTAHPAFAQLSAVGKEITITVKPEAVVIFSAHWQSGPSRIEVNVSKDAGIIYDFYGFPPHFYEYQYPYKGSPEVAERVIKKLTEANIETKRVKRGLDHGIWAGFMTGRCLNLGRTSTDNASL